MATTMDELIREWTAESGYDKRIDRNELLLRFLGEWLYSQYRPFPEKAPFWNRLFRWLNQIPLDIQNTEDQQTLFNFVPYLLFAAEEDLISMYRAAYVGPICRWLLDLGNEAFDGLDFDATLDERTATTWFGSLAGLDINTFCRVNGISGQSFRPEFRFIAQFCSIPQLATWLKSKKYKQIALVEDFVGTGKQFMDVIPVLAGLSDFPIIFVPLFIAPKGNDRIATILNKAEYSHVTYAPLFVLSHDCLVEAIHSSEDRPEIVAFRELNRRRNNGDLGFGKQYGTLVVTHSNCPNNVPPLVHTASQLMREPLFPRASRE